jgi:hypothetical protein
MPWLSELTGVPVQAMVGPSKRRQIGKVRRLLCFWAGREVGMTLTALAHRLRISVPTASVVAQMGEQIVDYEKLKISELLNVRAGRPPSPTKIFSSQRRFIAASPCQLNHDTFCGSTTVIP